MNREQNIFETAQDRKNEKEVMRAIAKHLGANGAHLAPKFYPVDGALLKDGVAFNLVEIKCRKIPSTKYPTLKLCLRKFTELNNLDQVLETLLVIRWTDKTGYAKICELAPERITVLKRHNIRYEGDEQLAVELNIKDFTFLPQEETNE
jgi:hypothetical protein